MNFNRGEALMKIVLPFLIITVLVTQVVALRSVISQSPTSSSKETVRLTGRWRVNFDLYGTGKKNLVFDSKASGAGSFTLLDTGPDNKPEPSAVPAAWAQTTNDRVSFSGEAEMPFGTCCREVGTLLFKGTFKSKDSIAGKVVFVGSSTDDENSIGFRSMIGTFIATRVSEN
jgi:hypothetical protein